MAIDWLDLDTPPALPGLFLRAALRRKVTGRQLPNIGLRCRVDVDPKHLARYRQVCATGTRAVWKRLAPRARVG